MAAPVTLEHTLSRLAREGELYERLAEGRLRCYACGHRCLILPGQKGICKVRWNEDGRLMVPTGYVAALQLDPIEKKPFFHAFPGARALSFGMLGCDLHCSYCFRGDTPVLTPTGAVAIKAVFDEASEAIVTPDGEIRFPQGVQVITASGAVRRVTKAFRHAYRGPLSVIRPMYLPAIRCTPDHRWLATTDPGGGGVEDVRAADLTPNHFLLVPKTSFEGEGIILDVTDLLKHVTPTFAIPRSLSQQETRGIMEASERGESSRAIGARLGRDPSYIRHVRSKVRRGRWVYEKTHGIMIEEERVRFPNERRPGIPRFLLLDKTFARLLGFYCAEGSVIRSKNRPNSLDLVFSFGHSEEAARKEIKHSLQQLFGVHPQEVRRATTTVVVVGKSSLALVLEALCGKGAAGKRIPAEIFAADTSVQEAFLDAYVAGDGHEYAGGKLSVTTVSRDLAYGVALLILRLGHLPSIYVTSVGAEGEIQGRAVRRHPEQFSVVWYRDLRSWQKFREVENHFLIPVKSVASEPFEGDVYNLEVEEEHSFVAGFCAVKNCQNALTSQALRDPAMGVPPQQIGPHEIVNLALHNRARVLTSTYNEPLITSEWAVEVFKEGRARGLVCSYVSNGNATAEVLDYIRPYVDLYKVDLKSFDDKHYRQLGGVLKTILEGIRMIHARGFWLEVVTLVIPGFNDSDAELRDIAQFLLSISPDIPWHVTAFHQDYKMTDRPNTQAKALIRAAEIGVGEGLRYVYAGNLPGHVGSFENTYCPSCKSLVIERVGYTILKDAVTPTRGVCPSCSSKIPGVWA
ncbi:MAG: radical SAM protein [Candidatus Rokubacteria bacterium]|nr:radical SAM protein [Candidatus Rokubacteria bacterium]